MVLLRSRLRKIGECKESCQRESEGRKGRKRAKRAEWKRLWKVCVTKQHKKAFQVCGVGRRMQAAIGRRTRCVDEGPSKKSRPLKPSENQFWEEQSCGRCISAGQIQARVNYL
jgi:hypothetical protein